MYEVLYRVPTASGNLSPLKSKVCKNTEEVDSICAQIKEFSYTLVMIRGI